jgi:hypothetical protein
MQRAHQPTALLSLALVVVLFLWRLDRNAIFLATEDATVQHPDVTQESDYPRQSNNVFRGPGEASRNQAQAQASEKFVADHQVQRAKERRYAQCCDLDFMIIQPISEFSELFAVANQPELSAPLPPGLWTIWYDPNEKENPSNYDFYTWMTYGPEHNSIDLPAYELAVAVHKDYVCGYKFELWSR